MIISHSDSARFKRYLDACEQRLLSELEDLGKVRSRVRGAAIVCAQDVPDDVATMNAQVRLRDLDSGRTIVCTVVLPPEDAMRVSTRSPLSWPALGLLGAQEGEELQLPERFGTRRVRLEKVLFRPQQALHRGAKARHSSAGRGSLPPPALIGSPIASRAETARSL
jgi:regulator of nucleoside diphosphate kinase